MALFGFIIVVLVLLAVPALIQFNPDVVTFNYYFGTLDTALSYAMLAAFAVGFLACLLILLPLYFRAGLKARRLAKAQKKSVQASAGSTA
ncbi:LapA family protein [Granulosicoccaceae sp. 1_MG-2023]|nr:LapA family protein [Granulosicoccaceae sp. 1_MG-2023]